jgi:hypothetical protein
MARRLSSEPAVDRLTEKFVWRCGDTVKAAVGRWTATGGLSTLGLGRRTQRLDYSSTTEPDYRNSTTRNSTTRNSPQRAASPIACPTTTVWHFASFKHSLAGRRPLAESPRNRPALAPLLRVYAHSKQPSILGGAGGTASICQRRRQTQALHCHRCSVLTLASFAAGRPDLRARSSAAAGVIVVVVLRAATRTALVRRPRRLSRVCGRRSRPRPPVSSRAFPAPARCCTCSRCPHPPPHSPPRPRPRPRLSIYLAHLSPAAAPLAAGSALLCRLPGQPHVSIVTASWLPRCNHGAALSRSLDSHFPSAATIPSTTTLSSRRPQSAGHGCVTATSILGRLYKEALLSVFGTFKQLAGPCWRRLWSFATSINGLSLLPLESTVCTGSRLCIPTLSSHALWPGARTIKGGHSTQRCPSHQTRL